MALILAGAGVYCIVIATARGVTRGADTPLVEPETITAFQYCSVMSPKGVFQARFLPPGPRDSRVPLVVFLHGSGERGNDNVRQLQPLPQKLFKDHAFPCCILAPQCVPDTPWMHWMPELEELIERTLQDDRIDPARVYLIGFSMGGSGCWELAARRPDLFAAAVPICGGGRTDWAGALKDLPIWAIHGSEDRAVSPERTREMIAAIEAVGGNPRFSELPGVGHGGILYTCDPNSGVLGWLFAQKREAAMRRTSRTTVFNAEEGLRPEGPFLPDQGETLGLKACGAKRSNGMNAAFEIEDERPLQGRLGNIGTEFPGFHPGLAE